MEFYHFFPSVTFVVMTADQFVGHDDGPLEPMKRSRIATFVEEIAHFFRF